MVTKTLLTLIGCATGLALSAPAMAQDVNRTALRGHPGARTPPAALYSPAPNLRSVDPMRFAQGARVGPVLPRPAPGGDGCTERSAPRPRASAYCSSTAMCRTRSGYPPRYVEICMAWTLIR